jgi:phosphoribosyl-ATP pyrophosphohydrolase
MATEKILAKFWATIESRRATLELRPIDSSVENGSQPPRRDMPFDTRALLQNPSKLRKKFNEEAYELNEAHQAALSGQEVDIGEKFGARDHVAREAADVLYHLYVLLASVDVTPEEVYAVMERRHEKDLERERRLYPPQEPVLAESGEPAA